MTNNANEPKKHSSKIIFAVVAILVVILLIVVIVKFASPKEEEKFNNNNVDNTVEQSNEKYVTTVDNNGTSVKLNNSSELNSTKKYKDIEISNIQFTSQNGISVLLANAKNTSSSKHKEETVKITILDDNNDEIATIEATIPDLEANETKQLNVIATADIVNAKDFTIKSK